MKLFLSLIALLLSTSAVAQTQKMNVDWVEDFPADMLTSLGSFECTGGGYPVGLYECSEGSGIHIRDLEGYTCLLTPELEVVATTWFNLSANWDQDYTGPVFGNWIVVPGEDCDPSVLHDPEDYFMGTYTGKRRLVTEGSISVWVGDWKLDGWGVGLYDGVQFKSKNRYRLYTELPLPYELTGVGTGPEGTITGKMIFHKE